MTPARKVREDTLALLKEIAVLFSHQSAYPLTAAQKAELQQTLPFYQEYGYSDKLAETAATSLYLLDNLTARHTLSAAELDRYLTEQGYVYGQYAALYRGEFRSYEYADDAAAREAAETARQSIVSHLDDPEYLEYLIWKYSEDYNSTPELIARDDFSEANQATLKNLREMCIRDSLQPSHRLTGPHTCNRCASFSHTAAQMPQQYSIKPAPQRGTRHAESVSAGMDEGQRRSGGGNAHGALPVPRRPKGAVCPEFGWHHEAFGCSRPKTRG